MEAQIIQLQVQVRQLNAERDEWKRKCLEAEEAILQQTIKSREYTNQGRLLQQSRDTLQFNLEDSCQKLLDAEKMCLEHAQTISGLLTLHMDAMSS